jgi:soluble lytic murein transglycosylase-like protein
VRRRHCLGVAGAALAALPRLVRAGGQVEEPLADAVRSALSAAVSSGEPPRPVFVDERRRQAYERWLNAMDGRLRRYEPFPRVRMDLLQTVWYESRRARLDADLVLGLIEVESGFRRHAISPAGAIGYMQVMPFWARLIGDGDPSRLFDLRVNLRYGCVILRHYLDMEGGDLFYALGRYNGSRGRRGYPEAVLAAARRWGHPDASEAWLRPCPPGSAAARPTGTSPS